MPPLSPAIVVATDALTAAVPPRMSTVLILSVARALAVSDGNALKLTSWGVTAGAGGEHRPRPQGAQQDPRRQRCGFGPQHGGAQPDERQARAQLRLVPSTLGAYQDAGLAERRRALTPERLAGANRDATAVAASQAAFPTAGSARAALLARNDVFADALAGGRWQPPRAARCC